MTLKKLIKTTVLFAFLALMGYGLWKNGKDAAECDPTSPHYNEHQCVRMTKD